MTGVESAWRVPPKIPAGKATIAVVVLAAVGLVLWDRGEWWQYAIAAAVTASLLVWAARDLLAPVRLAADAAGLTVVSGFASRQQLPWSQIERIRVDSRRHSRMLEVDVGEHLYLFSRYDLDADLDQVAATLERLRTGWRAG